MLQKSNTELGDVKARAADERLELEDVVHQLTIAGKHLVERDDRIAELECQLQGTKTVHA